MGYPRTDLPEEGSRQDQFAITLEVAGNNYGFWDKKTGGELDSDEVKYYPGATDQSVTLGGRRLPGNVTLQRLYDRDDDHEGRLVQAGPPGAPGNYRVGVEGLLDAVGKHTCTVTQRPLDKNGTPFGRKFQWQGTIKRVLIPDVDSEATGAALLEVEITVAGGSPSMVNG